MPYGGICWVHISSGNDLLPDGTKPIPEPMLTSDLVRFYGIHSRAISQWLPKLQHCTMSLKIILLKLHVYYHSKDSMCFLMYSSVIIWQSIYPLVLLCIPFQTRLLCITESAAFIPPRLPLTSVKCWEKWHLCVLHRGSLYSFFSIWLVSWLPYWTIHTGTLSSAHITAIYWRIGCQQI